MTVLVAGVAFAIGFALAVVMNRSRWLVFPLSGGAPLLGWMGGPPDGTRIVEDLSGLDLDAVAVPCEHCGAAAGVPCAHAAPAEIAENLLRLLRMPPQLRIQVARRLLRIEPPAVVTEDEVALAQARVDLGRALLDTVERDKQRLEAANVRGD